MSIIQFLRILWARKWIVVAGTLACVLGAVLVASLLPPRWEAKSRVMLEAVKPDPVSGEVFANSRGYIATQVELIKDYAVAGQVADDLGLMSDPGLIRAYQNRSKKDHRDFRRWVTQIIVDGTSAELLQGSNILEITYTSDSPERARTIADALRKAYTESSRAFRVEQAAKNAEWYEGQADKARQALEEAEKIETDYERANGIVLEKNGAELEQARLAALTGSAATQAPIITPITVSPARTQLARVDSEISEQSKVLGPNHPTLVALRANRQALEQQVVQDEKASRETARAAASSAAAGVGALQSAFNAQRSRVMAQRDKVERARQLQADADMRRDLYTKTAAKVAEFRHEAQAPVTGITMLGSAVVPQKPKFPNWTLVIFGSIVLGLGAGLGMGLLMELFGRRIRGPEDLRDAIDAPLLAIITKHRGRAKSVKWAMPSLPGGLKQRPPRTRVAA